jgi:alanine racemase
LQEVAELADVSMATVSRVLNSRPGVADATRERVLAVLSSLGYDELPVRTENSGVVGIVTPELVNPIFSLMAQTIESRLASRGLLSMVCPATSDTVNEQEYLDHFERSNAAGVVVVSGRYAGPLASFEPYHKLIQAGIPVVLVNGAQHADGVPLVAIDLRAGIEESARHLVSLGHTKIGLMTGPRRYLTHQIQVDAFGSITGELGIEAAPVSETLFTGEGGRAGVATLIEAGVTGIITASDLMAIGAIEGIRSWGLSVPEDISVIGFDGTIIARLVDPPLTTLRQPVERMASAVSSLLTTKQVQQEVHLYRPDLMVGRSTARVKTLAPKKA